MRKLIPVLLLLVAMMGSCGTKLRLQPQTGGPLVVKSVTSRMDGWTQKSATTDTIGKGQTTPHVLIVMYDSAVGKKPLLEEVRKMKCEVVYDYSIIPGMALRVPDSLDIQAAKARLEKVKGVLQVNFDRICHLD
jgi:hypothetical protein